MKSVNRRIVQPAVTTAVPPRSRKLSHRDRVLERDFE